MFAVLDKLDEEFPHHAFGTSNKNELFVDGKKVTIPWQGNHIIKRNMSKNVEEALYEELKELLLKNKIITKKKEEE